MTSEVAPPKPLQSGPWTPTWWSFPITTSFGAPTAGDPGRPHLGVDFAVPLGTPIQAAGVGTIDKVFSDQAGGHQVQVKYAQGGTGWFAHLNDILVNAGDAVNPSTIIGHSGVSGATATGPHLHFQLLNQGGQSVDPTAQGVFSQLVSRNGAFAASGDCPAGWHRGNMGGAGFCVPDGVQFGGGDPAKNLRDVANAVTPNVSGLNLGPSITVPGFEGVGAFFSGLGNAFRPQNLWRAAFIAVGAGAVFVGGRMYLSNSEAPRVSEGVPSG